MVVSVPRPHTPPTDCSHVHAPLETLKLVGRVKGIDRRTLPALDWGLWQYRSALFASRYPDYLVSGCAVIAAIGPSRDLPVGDFEGSRAAQVNVHRWRASVAIGVRGISNHRSLVGRSLSRNENVSVIGVDKKSMPTGFIGLLRRSPFADSTHLHRPKCRVFFRTLLSWRMRTTSK
jgi:hypothetical protein